MNGAKHLASCTKMVKNHNVIKFMGIVLSVLIRIALPDMYKHVCMEMVLAESSMLVGCGYLAKR